VYALAWVVGMAEAVAHTSRFTHNLDLQDPETKAKLTLSGTNFEPLLALYEFRSRREQALDTLLQKLPVAAFLCKSDQLKVGDPRMREAGRYLRENLRSAIKSPDLLADRLENFLRRIDGPLHFHTKLARNDDRCPYCRGVKAELFSVAELMDFETAVTKFPSHIVLEGSPAV